MTLADLPADIFLLVLNRALGYLYPERIEYREYVRCNSTDSWYDGLVLISVCHGWRKHAVPVVYGRLFISILDLRSQGLRLITNVPLARANGFGHYAKSLRLSSDSAVDVAPLLLMFQAIAVDYSDADADADEQPDLAELRERLELSADGSSVPVIAGSVSSHVRHALPNVQRLITKMEFTHAHALALSSIVSQYGSQLEMLFIEQTGHCIEVLNPELALEFNAQLEDKVVLDPNGNVKADIPQPLPLSVDARYARRIYYCDNVPHDRRIPLWNRSSSNDLRFDKLEELDLRSDTLFTPCFNNTDWSDVKFPSLKRLSVFRFAITPRFVECLQQAPLRRLEYRVGDINSIRNLAPVVGKLEHLQLECDFRKFVEPERVRSQFIRDSHEDMMGVLNSALKKAQNARVVRVGLIWSDVCLRVSKLDCPFITHLSVQGAFEFRDLLTVLPTMVNLVDLMLFNISAAEADSEQDAVWLRDYNRGCMDRPASNVKKLKLGYETSAMMRFYNEQLENIQWFIPNAKITIEEMYDY